ncbi:MAG: cupin domain-containing protein [Betaproteobacteria bacterium]|nr:cupin domain-containing protein [Betaproteobacteria bacterium]
MVWRVRRVYTGHNKQGRAVIIQDGPAPNVKEMASMPGLALTDLWETTGPLASNEGNGDAADRTVRLEPPRGGSILRIVEFPPDKAWRDSADAKAAFESIGAGHAKDKQSADPMMHKTSTVDYIIVISGEIYAVVEEGEVLLKPGDVFIQRGTNHSWSVRGDVPCVIAAVLVSAAPLGKPAVRKKPAGKPVASKATRATKATKAKKATKAPAKRATKATQATKAAKSPAKRATKAAKKAARGR